MKSPWVQALRCVGHPRVVVLGDVMLDHYIFGDVSRISPEAPIPVLRVQREDFRLGGAGGVTAHLAVLGADVQLLGAVGDDSAGRKVRELCVRLGLTTAGLAVVDGRRTTVKSRQVARAGAVHQQILRVDQEDEQPCAAAVEESLLQALGTALGDADVLVLSDYAKGTLTPTLLGRAIAMGRAADVPVLVDPKGSDFTRYRGATALTPNRREAAHATGMDLSSPDAIRTAGKRLVEQARLETAVITLDRDGMALFHRDGTELWVPTRVHEVFDVTGAGDMVVATLALALGGGLEWETAVGLANTAAGVEVRKLGSAAVTRAEIIQALEEEDRSPGKVVALAELLPALEARRAAGARVVFTNGCFDVLHAGHTRYLARARSEGDLLVVGINADDSVRRLKGAGRPIIPLADRAEVLAALACVDFVVSFAEDTPRDLIQAVQPDVLVKGEDWRNKVVVGRDVVEARGGRVVFAPMLGGRSTTSIVERIARQCGPV